MDLREALDRVGQRLSSPPYPSCTYYAEVEVRRHGAIGIFREVPFEVRAENGELALLYIQDDAESAGLEIRFIKNLRRMDDV